MRLERTDRQGIPLSNGRESLMAKKHQQYHIGIHGLRNALTFGESVKNHTAEMLKENLPLVKVRTGSG